MGQPEAINPSGRTPGAADGVFDTYIDYSRALLRATTLLSNAEEAAKKLDLKAHQELAAHMIRRLEVGAFSISVVGEFKRGKSTFINALLGRSILPADVVPATATINRVVYGRRPSVTLFFKDGTTQEIGIDDLPGYVTKITDQSRAIAETIREAQVTYPTLFCQNNVQIVDTPGLGDEENMTTLTLRQVADTDVAVFVISALAPFSQTERALLKRLLETLGLARMMFVINMIDRLRQPEDAKRIIDFVRARITAMAKQYPANAVTDAQALTQRIKVFGLSSFQAVTAKQNKDGELFQESGFEAFQRSLEAFLARERGAAALQPPLSALNEITTNALDQIALRKRRISENGTTVRAEYKKCSEWLSAALRDLGDQRSRFYEWIAALSAELASLANDLRPRLEKVVDQCIGEFRLMTGETGNAHCAEKRLSDLIRTSVRTECANIESSLQRIVRTALVDQRKAIDRVVRDVETKIEPLGVPLRPLNAEPLLREFPKLESLQLALTPDDIREGGRMVDAFAAPTLTAMGKIFGFTKRFNQRATTAAAGELLRQMAEHMKRIYRDRARREIRSELKRLDVTNALSNLSQQTKSTIRAAIENDISHLLEALEQKSRELERERDRKLAALEREENELNELKTKIETIKKESALMAQAVSAALVSI